MVIVFNYALHLPLGFQHAMNREAPFYLGRQEWERVKAIDDVTFMVTLITAVTACAGILAVQCFFGYSLFNFSLVEAGLVAFVIVTQQIYSFYSILLRNRMQFSVFSWGFGLSAMLGLLLAIPLAFIWQAKGPAFAQGLAYLLIIVYWCRASRFRILAISFSNQDFTRLFKLAIPLFLVGLSALLINSIDRLAVAFFYSDEDIGFYGLAFLMAQSIYLIVVPILQAITPRLMQSYGRHQKPEQVRHYLLLLTEGMGYGSALLVGGLYLVFGALCPIFLPRYIPAIATINIRLIGSVFSAVAAGVSTFLIALDKQTQMLKFQVGVILFQLISIGLVVYGQGDIDLIAGMTAGGYVIYAILSLLWAGASVKGSIREGISLCLKSCLPIAYVLLVTVLIGLWQMTPSPSGVVVILLKWLVWLILMIPSCIYIWREMLQVKKQT
jgi:O-antigen/teichoic acid export membrane protein